ANEEVRSQYAVLKRLAAGRFAAPRYRRSWQRPELTEAWIIPPRVGRARVADDSPGITRGCSSSHSPEPCARPHGEEEAVPKVRTIRSGRVPRARRSSAFPATPAPTKH